MAERLSEVTSNPAPGPSLSRSAADECPPGLLDERGDIGGLRRDGQRAGVDAARIEETGESRGAHVIRLVGFEKGQRPVTGFQGTRRAASTIRTRNGSAATISGVT